MQSVTSMFDCTHGPKKDCHACLVGELVEVLEFVSEYAHNRGLHGERLSASPRPLCGFEVCMKARALIEKAHLIEDCIPIEEAEEASRG